MTTKFDSICEKMTPGMLKAFSRPMVVKKECNKCGLLIPKYQGRYPATCPTCGDPINKDDAEIVQEPEEGTTDGEVTEQESDETSTIFDVVFDAVGSALEDRGIEVSDDDLEAALKDLISKLVPEDEEEELTETSDEPEQPTAD